MKTKRIISLLLSLAMIMGLMVLPQATTLAYDDGNGGQISADRANVSFVYLGKTGAITEYPSLDYKPVPDMSDFAKDDIIWVGVQFSNMSKVRDLFRSDKGGTEDGGLGKICFGMTYDKTYLTPVGTRVNLFNNIGIRRNYPTQDTDDGIFYNYVGGNPKSALAVSGSANESEGCFLTNPDDALDVTQEIQLNKTGDYYNASGGRMFQDPVSDDAVMMASFAFKLNQVPTSAIKILQANMAGDRFFLGCGDSMTSPTAMWLKTQSSSSNGNLKNYFNLTNADGSLPSDGVVNLFPDDYTVEFYNTKDDVDTGNKLSGKDLVIKAGESASSSSLSLPTESDLTPPANEVFLGFGYDDPDNPGGDPKSFTKDTPINANMFANPTDTVLKVYAQYGPGHTVTFNSNYGDIADAPSATTKPVTIAQDATSIDVAKKPTVGKADDTPTPDFIVPDGYAFKEWNTDPAGTGTTLEFSDGTTPTDVVGDSITDVYAIWEKAVTLTFHKNDGSGDKTTAIGSPTENFTGTVPTVTRDHYTFVEWNTESNGSGTSYADAAAINGTTFATDTDLYAIWTPDNTLPTSTLTFDPVRTDVTPNPQSVTVNTNDLVFTANIPVFNIADYTYTWHESAALSDTNEIDFDTGYAVTEDKTVYAHWTYTGADAVTVNFYDEDGTTKLFDTQVAPNTKIPSASMPVATKTGASFKEWRTATGGGGDVFDENYTITANLDVYAVYSPDIKITYDPNGGTNDSSITGPVIGAVSDVYTNPADPTRTSANGSYKFLGWNTKQNGSGQYVAADGSKTYGDISTSLFDGDAEITVYAQWAAVPDDDKDKVKDDDPTDPANPDPTNKGVKVTFDSNVGGNLTNGTVTDANRKYYYPVYGDSLGSLPDSPTRDNYVFQKWNTKPDGSGTDITATTEFGDNLGDDLQEIAGTNISYEITVYAIWDIDPNVPANDQITITFNANKDGKGTASADDKVIKVYRGDSVGYDVNPPENGTFEFASWFEGTADVTTGVIEFDVDKEFDPTAAINPAAGTTVTYYADWDKFLKVELVDNGSGSNTAEANYTGNVIVPKYTIYQMDQNGDKVGNDLVTNSDLSGTDYAASYTKNGTVTDLKDVGTYGIDVSVSNADLAAQGVEVGLVVPSQFEVKGATLTIKVDPDTQKQKQDTSVNSQNATITADGLINGEALEDVMDIKYYLWTDAESSLGADNADGEIQDTELSEVANPTAIGKYVIKITPKENSNYAVGTVISSVEGKNVEFYPTTAGTGSSYPVYAAGEVGKNIVFEIQANDPSASSITVKAVKDDVEKDAELMDETYTTTKPLAVYDESATDHSDDYWTRVDKGTESVKISVTPAYPDGTTVTVTVGGNPITPNPDGSYSIPIDSEHNGKNTTDITVSLSAGTAPDQKTQEYIIHVQQLTDVKIEYNPGNSPYGMIERMAKAVNPWGAEKIKKAKEEFDNSSSTIKTYHADYIPDIIDATQTEFEYSVRAWEQLDKNYDMVDEAIFVYTANKFTDPGFTIYDQAGETVTVTAANLKKVLKVNTIEDLIVPVYTDDEIVDKDREINEDADGKFDLKGLNIRPDLYKIEYEYTYTDLEDGTQKTFTSSRPVIILARRGDVELSATPIINGNDGSQLSEKWSDLVSNSALFAFRSAEIDVSDPPIINGNDGSVLEEKWADGFKQYYTTLD